MTRFSNLFIIINICQNKGGLSITADDFYRNVFHLKDENLIQEIVNATEIRHLKKGEFVVRIGEVQNDVYFLETGIARGYFLDVNGKDVTDCFGFRCGTAAVSFGQLEVDVPSSMTIEMLEDGRFFCVPISIVIRLQKNYEEAMTLYNQLLIAAMKAHWELKRVLNSCTAVQRYQWFLDEYPGLIGKVSNKYIASFLGITPVTLSRLRRTLREGKQSEENKRG